MEEDRPPSGPRRSGLVQERSRRTRRALVAAALALWTERGFDDGIDETTVEEIVRAAGVTKGTFYFHFAHKEDILLEIGWGTAEAMFNDASKYLADELPVEEAFDKLLTTLARRISAGPRVAVARTIAEFYRLPARPVVDPDGTHFGFKRSFVMLVSHAAGNRAAATGTRCACAGGDALLADDGRDQRVDHRRKRQSRGRAPRTRCPAPRRCTWRRRCGWS